MGLFRRIFGGPDVQAPYRPLYAAIVAVARDPAWYRAGAVPDTLDGRFDMVSSVLALVLLRLEAAGGEGAEAAARVTEIFITDMDGQLRQQGIGDIVVGKHVGRMMGQLGGRLAAYREGLAEEGDLAGAIDRNIYRGSDAGADARGHVEMRLRALADRLEAHDVASVIAGRIA